MTSELDLTKATEAEMRDYKVGWPKSEDELLAIVRAVADRQHDYGTCVYAMSIAATAAFHYIAGKLGVTGFQASCADLAILGQTRNLKRGRVLDFDNLLYPQYRDKFDLSFDDLIDENADWLAEEAAKKLDESPNAHPEVVAHWQYLLARSRSPQGGSDE